MIEKSDLDPLFGAWYDHKMDPANKELLRQHRSTLDEIARKLSQASGQHLDAGDVRAALWPRFGQWMREKDLPPPPKS